MSAIKGVPLAKNEVALLIDLVEANKVIMSKATNASNNKLKEAAWCKVTKKFNASVSSVPRSTNQLKLKWDNLKKSARKRSRMSLIETGGGKPDFIPPDDPLDRVASLLGATCEGCSDSLGRDAEETDDSEVLSDGGGIVVIDGDGDRAGEGDVEPKPNKFFFNTPSGSKSNKQKRKLLEDDIRARVARNQAIAEYYKIKKKKLELEIETMEHMRKIN
ncbi:hypothetical protein ABMA27_009860 [Loxostege sticticalis]|uniref:Regulatory protein zeste n=1 Tax=Loxostege sticticalis TaxID=481309 RepID=A0ABR3H6Q7_LOXSC